MADKRTREILDIFEKMYTRENKCFLNYNTPWQLLFATILSAQCTDERVNVITEALFKKYSHLDDFAEASLEELKEDIKSAGFYHNKAKSIIGCARILLDKYNGEVPKEIDRLTELPGVGRKTANVIRGNVYNIPSIVVDTHVKRISGRLGLTDETDPVKIEFDLMNKIPEEYWIFINHWFIKFGRESCKAQTPKCPECPLAGYCRDPKRNQ